MHRGNVDDAAPALAVPGGKHGGKCQPRRMKSATQVDGDDGVPLVGREVLNSRHVLNARVIDQYVNPAKLRRGVLHHVFNFGGLAHVGAVVGDLHTNGFYFGPGPVHVAKAVEHDIGALRRKSFGNTQADTAGGARDERCFTFKHAWFSW